MNVRARMAAAALAVAAIVLAVPAAADAQPGRVAVPRRAVVRPAIVVRPSATVFIGGYYVPALYRAQLYYGGYRGYSGAPYYYQRPPYSGIGYDLSGSVRLQVSPKQAEVFVDGYYAGTVDDFDGMFQRLHVEPGEHDLELFLPGHRTHHQRVYVQPGRTFQIRHTMEPLAPGDAEPARPAAAPPPPQAGPQYPGPARLPSADPRVPGAPSRVPPPGARAEGFGRLSLRVQPADAEVLIDGDVWEGALDEDRLVVELGAGVHRLEIRKEGYRSYFTDVTIRETETRTLNVALTTQ